MEAALKAGDRKATDKNAARRDTGGRKRTNGGRKRMTSRRGQARRAATPAATARGATAASSPATRTAAQQAAQARMDAEQAAMRRWQCNLFGFWRDCEQRACRRAKRCSGDSVACLTARFPLLPEEIKIWYRATIKARCAGLSANEAHEAGVVAVAQYLQQQSESAPATAPTAAVVPAPAIGPLPGPAPTDAPRARVV
jgi:hypothetical protein